MTRYHNWILLDLLLERLSMTWKQLETAHPNIQPVTLPVDQFQQAVQESQILKSTFADVSEGTINDPTQIKDDSVTLVELNDNLRRVLGVEVERSR